MTVLKIAFSFCHSLGHTFFVFFYSQEGQEHTLASMQAEFLTLEHNLEAESLALKLIITLKTVTKLSYSSASL